MQSSTAHCTVVHSLKCIDLKGFFNSHCNFFCKSLVCNFQYFRKGWRSHWRLSHCTTEAAWRTKLRLGLGLRTKVSTSRLVRSVRRRERSFWRLNMGHIKCRSSEKDWRFNFCWFLYILCWILQPGWNVDVWSPSETIFYRGRHWNNLVSNVIIVSFTKYCRRNQNQIMLNWISTRSWT